MKAILHEIIATYYMNFSFNMLLVLNGSLRGKRNQYILFGQDSVLYTAENFKVTTNFPT